MVQTRQAVEVSDRKLHGLPDDQAACPTFGRRHVERILKHLAGVPVCAVLVVMDDRLSHIASRVGMKNSACVVGMEYRELAKGDLVGVFRLKTRIFICCQRPGPVVPHAIPKPNELIVPLQISNRRPAELSLERLNVLRRAVRR